MPEVFINKKVETSANRSDTSAGHKVGLFHTFCEYPSGVTFEHQETDEEIILFVRRHIITNVPWIITTFLLLLLPPIFIPFFSLITVFPLEIPPALISITTLAYYLVVFGYALINFLHWFYNIGIVTAKNVIDIDYSDIVNVHVSATKSSQIEDVSYAQGGFFRSFFNYGDVLIQTAGTNANFEYQRIPNPGKAVDIIHDLIGNTHHA